MNGDESGRGVVLIPACEEILGVITANTMKEWVDFDSALIFTLMTCHPTVDYVSTCTTRGSTRNVVSNGHRR